MNLDLEKIENLNDDEKIQVQKIIKELEIRKKAYPILNFKPQQHQQEFMDAISQRNPDGSIKYKFIIFLGGNGAGKTVWGAYATILMALGKDLCKKFNLPYIGEAGKIKIFSTTGDNIRDNIDRKYLLGTGRNEIVKIPGYVNKDEKGPIVTMTRHDKEILKELKLVNGTVITCGTYDQGQARLQGGEPDFTWMDELPTRFADLIEIMRGTRNKFGGQLLITATPTNYNKKIHDYIFSPKFKDIAFIKQVDSFDNSFADHSWMEGLSEEDKRIRRFGSFTPPEGLVYPNFNPSYNVIKHINPRELPDRVRFYGAVDFGFKHPTAFLFIAVDSDGHIYIFDLIYESGLLMKDLANKIREKKIKYNIEFQYIVADSSGAVERNELKAEGIITKAINKKAKVGKSSFRAGGILKVNQLFKLGKLIISDECKPLIEELQIHHFKDNGEVDKTNDDAIDALRYFVTEYTSHSEVREYKKMKRKLMKKAQRKRRY